MAGWFTSVWRNLVKHKAFTLLNATGLLMGIGSFAAILLYVSDELKFDDFHDNAGRIYRINVTTSYDGSDTRYPTVAAPLAEYVSRDIPEVEKVSRLFGREATLQVMMEDSSLVADKKFREENFFIADPAVFKLFSFRFIAGNSETALSTSNKVVLSEKIADKYFGSASSAMGRVLMFEGAIPMEVSGVFANWPSQSSNNIEIVSHFDNYYAMETPEVQDFLRRDWLYNPLQTYVLLQPSASVPNTTRLIQQLNERYADERVRDHVRYDLQPLTDIHLRSDFTHATDRNTIRYIYIFLAVGVLILAIASINFVNLSTVHSLRRAKEIGVRKVVGASRQTLLWHFLFESLLLTVVSGIMAMVALYYVLPTLNQLTGKTFDGRDLFNWDILSVILPVMLVTGIAAGIYPSFYVSGINAVSALKGLKTRVTGGQYLVRRILVAAQFAASIVLIIFTMVIFRQISYMQSKPLGFQKEFMLTIPLFSANPNSILGGGVNGDLRARMNTFETEVAKYASVEAVSVSSNLPGHGAVFALVTTDSIKETANLFVPIVSVDYDFLDAYAMQVIAGRGFSREAGTDHLEAFVANEEALSVLGFHDAEKAIGQRVNALGKQGAIIGVIRNYHFQGLQQPLRPLMMEVAVSKFTVFSLRLKGGNLPASIESVRTVWNNIFPERVFEYDFLDSQLAQGYEAEQRFGGLINVFSALAVAISALGLFGLAAYVSIQRQKEAGIRKVLGATTVQVFYALSKEFVRIFIIASVVALPAGYLVASSWLGTFAYQAGVGWLPLVLSLVATFTIVLMTTVFQTLRTASVNPAKTIRNE